MLMIFFLSKVIINIQCETLFPKHENGIVCTGIHIYKTKHHSRTGFIMIFDPENIGLENLKSKLS